jgi:polyisoprenyl-teichoic acid--peptidoglycan teichoic acid transferase
METDTKENNILKKILNPKLKRKVLQHVWLVRTFIIIAILLIVIILASILFKPVKNVLNKILLGPKLVSTFFSDPLYTLPNYNGHTNILFLGMGGGNHDGATLTDTIIFTSLNLKDDQVTMVSIPRDIWVASIEAKINAAYAVGENIATGSGSLLAKDAVYEIVGEPIHLVVTLDFDGFEQLINALGGVDVYVDKNFVDEWYPIEGKENDLCDGDLQYQCRYETISFEQGLQHMDGTTALKFSRSRHSDDDEGTDFARSVRQQKVIAGIRKSAISAKVLLNPKKINELKNLTMKYVIIDEPISEEEYSAFAGFGIAFWRSENDVQSLTLETGDDDNPGFLINPPIEKYGQWVLESRFGDWADFQDYLRQKID